LKNPVQKHIELLFNLPADKGMNLNLYNLLGQRIRTYQINQSISGRISLPTDGLSSGVYFLKSEGYEGGLIKVVVVK
ncbi:MAG: T9SS type A sorting domain-containing protein, partial [bacterium]